MIDDTESDFCDRLPGQHTGRLSLELQAREAAEWQRTVMQLEFDIGLLQVRILELESMLEKLKASSAAGESAVISPDPAQAHGLTTPATPSSAVGASGPVAGDKPFRLEYGKRYLRRDGKVSGTLTATHSRFVYRSEFPFCDVDNNATYRPDGTYQLNGSNHGNDLIAEYHEPDPSPPADPELDRLQRELDAAVEYHDNYTSKIDKALGQPRHGGDLLTEHLREIERLTYLPPTGSPPADSPNDWVKQDRVPLRKIDEFRYLFASGFEGSWCTGSDAEDSTIVHNAVDEQGDRIEIRCRRKDLPVMPHHVACSADRSNPYGSPGCSCPTLDGVPVTGSTCPEHGLETGDLNAQPNKPRMRQVTLREYRYGINGSDRAWTTVEGGSLLYTGRTWKSEVPE